MDHRLLRLVGRRLLRLLRLVGHRSTCRQYKEQYSGPVLHQEQHVTEHDGARHTESDSHTHDTTFITTGRDLGTYDGPFS